MQRYSCAGKYEKMYYIHHMKPHHTKFAACVCTTDLANSYKSICVRSIHRAPIMDIATNSKCSVPCPMHHTNSQVMQCRKKAKKERCPRYGPCSMVAVGGGYTMFHSMDWARRDAIQPRRWCGEQCSHTLCANCGTAGHRRTSRRGNVQCCENRKEEVEGEHIFWKHSFFVYRFLTSANWVIFACAAARAHTSLLSE